MKLSVEDIKQMYYVDGMSASDVGKRFGISVWQVIRFMQKNSLPRRDQAETHRIKYHAAPLSYKAKSELTNKEKELKIAGLMLYWGEGSKIGEETVDLANSDPRMIQVFLKMLREVYGVSEQRLRVYLYCYANQDIKTLIEYWTGVTKINSKQFSKPYVRHDFLEKSKGRMPYGLVHIRYNDKKLLARIKADTEIIKEKFI